MIDSHCHLAGRGVRRPISTPSSRARGRPGVTGALVHPRGRTTTAECERARARARRVAGGAVRRSASIRTSAGEFAGRRRRGAARRSRARRRDAPARARSARSASTTTTTSRRATCSRRSSARRSRLARELRPAGRHPHARGRRRHVRASCARRRRASVRGVLHCFTGDDGDGAARARPRVLHLARRDRDVSEGRRACGKPRGSCPLDRLLIETDSPFLAPVPHRGKRNEPAHVARVVEALAELHGVPPRRSARTSTRQFPRAVRARNSLSHATA